MVDNGVASSNGSSVTVGRSICWVKNATLGRRSMLSLNPIGLRKFRSVDGQVRVGIEVPFHYLVVKKPRGLPWAIKLGYPSVRDLVPK